jgi:hypothetical protein
MSHRVRVSANWVLAVLTVPAALFVMAVGFGGAMGTDRCAYEDCARRGPPFLVFMLLFYGAPLVAVLSIVASFRTARRSWGVLVPLAAFGLFAIEVVVLYLSYKS